MKETNTTIDIRKRTRRKLNELKYKLGMRSQDNTVLFLIQFYQMETSKKPKCENCGEVEVEHKGDWCDDCNLPKKGDPRN